MAKAFPIKHCVYIDDPADQHIRYRRIIPKNLRERFFNGRTEWSHTFPRGTSLGEIERTAKALAVQHRALLARAKAGEIINEAVIEQAQKDAAVFMAGDKAALYEWQAFLATETQSAALPFGHPYRIQLNALEHGGKFVPEMVTLAGANATRPGKRGNRDIANAIKDFVRVIGERDVRAIRRSDVKRFVEHEIARGNRPSSVRRRCISLQGIITAYFDDNEIAQPNPFARLKIDGAAHSLDDKFCFDRAMLAKIDAYVAKSKRMRPETKHMFALLKLTGAGPKELGGLLLGDVVLDHAVPHIVIEENDVRGLKVKAQDGKADSPRKRRVPLIGEALEAAKDAVAHAKRRGAKATDRLFTRGFGDNGRGADNISANLNSIIDRAGIRSKKHTLYSYRHTLKEAFVAAGIEEHLRYQIMGHSSGDPSEKKQRRQSASHNKYGGRRPLPELRDALLEAVPRLGDVATEEAETAEAAE
jgi:integrase